MGNGQNPYEVPQSKGEELDERLIRIKFMIKRTRDLDELKKMVAAMTTTGALKKDSDGYFQPYIEKNGSGSAILRILETMPNEEWPFVQLFNHAFQVDGKWFIETCPTKLNKPCPVCESNVLL